MSCIKYKQSAAFDAKLHQQIAAANHPDRTRALNGFRVARYVRTANFSFQLGWGQRESPHTDLPDYQALAIIDPNGWVLKSPKDSHTRVYQQPGDLILLDQGKVHHVVWDKLFPKPTSDWVYLFVDLHDRSRWTNLATSIALAQAAMIELSSPSTIARFN